MQVEKMAKQFNVAEDVSYTCETAAHFWLLHVLARWEMFLATVAQRKTPECVKVGDLLTARVCLAAEVGFVLHSIKSALAPDDSVESNWMHGEFCSMAAAPHSSMPEEDKWQRVPVVHFLLLAAALQIMHLLCCWKAC